MISIIIPTHNRHEQLIKILASIESNTYTDKEVIVVDDNSTDKGATRQAVSECKKHFKTNILYLNTHYDKYGLAMARNMGAIEAMGSILMFLDDRYTLDSDVLEKVSKMPDHTWCYGKKRVKGEIVHKRPFIENFSWIPKGDFRKFGGFNERLNMYGGQSQDVRERCSLTGIKIMQVDAYATEITRSQSNHRKDQIWKAKLILSKLND